MSGATYNTPEGRRNKVKGEILGHAIPTEALGIAGQVKQMPKKEGDNIVFRRWLPYGASNTDANTINRWIVDANLHVLQEGVTPSADSLVPQDITVVMNQYGCLYMYTDRQNDLHEDDLPPEMKKQVGERMGLVREMIRYGAVKQCTNVYYAGGTSRSTVDESLSNNLLSLISRSIMGNHGKPITRVLAASPNFNTAGIESGFLVFAHTDLEHDIRELEGFISTSAYGQKKTVHENELGSVGRFRFIVSADLTPVPDIGAAVGTTGLYSTTGTSIDVYPVVVTGEDAYGDVALRGANSFDHTDLKPGTKDKQDPLGQRGYVGAKFYSAAGVWNDGHMAIAEVGATALS